MPESPDIEGDAAMSDPRVQGPLSAIATPIAEAIAQHDRQLYRPTISSTKVVLDLGYLPLAVALSKRSHDLPLSLCPSCDKAEIWLCWIL